uniref:Uncharacterized protein n=1 Tax=Anguilla anguilla TaxID=7936 RepID=A0A0E9VKB8_ANGAN
MSLDRIFERLVSLIWCLGKSLHEEEKIYLSNMRSDYF